jgi:hypothetical protein
MPNVKIKSPTTIEHIRELLNQDRPQDALKYIEHLGQKTPDMENARGVCLMRLGKIEEALSVLREVVFQGYICMPSDTPVLYQINFATAMLLSNHKDGAFSILNKLDKKVYPQLVKIKDVVRRWVRSLNFIEKCGYYFGLYPNKPVTIDFVPGEI